MIIQFLLVAHIVVLGYWLGSEFVINSTFRYVSYNESMPFQQRNQLMNHVLDADQHVRYALVMQLALGGMLAVLLGYFPGGQQAAIVIALVGIAWLILVEFVHRARQKPVGKKLAAVDRTIRYCLMFTLVAIWGMAMFGSFEMQAWLAWKLSCFVAVMACGIAIRFEIIKFYKTWQDVEQHGSSSARQISIEQVYVRATTILIALWVFIGAIVILSIWKPG